METLLFAAAMIGIEEEVWRVLQRAMPHHFGSGAHFVLFMGFLVLGMGAGIVVKNAGESTARNAKSPY